MRVEKRVCASVARQRAASQIEAGVVQEIPHMPSEVTERRIVRFPIVTKYVQTMIVPTAFNSQNLPSAHTNLRTQGRLSHCPSLDCHYGISTRNGSP